MREMRTYDNMDYLSNEPLTPEEIEESTKILRNLEEKYDFQPWTSEYRGLDGEMVEHKGISLETDHSIRELNKYLKMNTRGWFICRRDYGFDGLNDYDIHIDNCITL